MNMNDAFAVATYLKDLDEKAVFVEHEMFKVKNVEKQTI